MMRKVLSILLVLVLLVSLTACGGTGDGESSTPNVGTTTGDGTASTTVEGGTSATDDTTGGDDTTAGTSDASTTGGDTTTGGKDTTATATTSTGKVTSTTKVTTNAPTTKTPTTSKTTNPDVNGEWVTMNGSSKNLKTWVYQLADSGLLVREARFDSGKGGDPATIIAAADIHFTVLNDKDRQENNASLMWTAEKRKGAWPNSVKNAERIMDYAASFDQTVWCGDSMDYLSYGNIEQIKKTIWGKDPNALVAMGNHEMVRTMNMAGEIKDNSSLDSRYAILEKEWKHDIYYTSKVVKNKVMVIQMDNSQNRFWASQVPKLKADLDTARKNGYVVLLFYHIALSTGNTEDRRLQSFYPKGTTYNFYDGCVDNQDDATIEMYKLITNNADVIKGAFCGHEHQNFYMEIKAKTPDGKDAAIPQYVLTSSHTQMGAIMKITVK